MSQQAQMPEPALASAQPDGISVGKVERTKNLYNKMEWGGCPSGTWAP